jgi:hypothetical protein
MSDSYTLHLGHPDAEPYTGLTQEELRSTFTDEVRRSITDMGSDGYDPTFVLEQMGIDYNPDDDPDGEIWNKAAEADIERRTQLFVQSCIAALLRTATNDESLSNTIPLPDGIRVWVTIDDEQ